MQGSKWAYNMDTWRQATHDTVMTVPEQQHTTVMPVPEQQHTAQSCLSQNSSTRHSHACPWTAAHGTCPWTSRGSSVLVSSVDTKRAEDRRRFASPPRDHGRSNCEVWADQWAWHASKVRGRGQWGVRERWEGVGSGALRGGEVRGKRQWGVKGRWDGRGSGAWGVKGRWDGRGSGRGALRGGGSVVG